MHAIYWKHVTTACAKWQLDLLWGYLRKSTASKSRVNYTHLLLCSYWLNLGKNLFISRIKMENVSHTNSHCWQDQIQPTMTKNSLHKHETVKTWAGQWQWHRTSPSGVKTFLASGTCVLAESASEANFIPLSHYICLLPTMSHLYLRDTACEPFFKPRNSPSYIVQSILGSLYNPANLNDPCQIQWILINLWTEICRETKLHLCNYGITLKSHFPLHLWDSNRLSKEEYLETWWKGAKLCSPLHRKRHGECKTQAYIMTRWCWLGVSNHSLYTASFIALENRKQTN